MSNQLKEILDQYAAEINGLYGAYLKAVILYGSYARGDYREDSDIDIMILVDLPEEEIRKSWEKLLNRTYDFNELYDLKIMPVLVASKQFAYWLPVYPFYQNVRNEGVSIYAA